MRDGIVKTTHLLEIGVSHSRVAVVFRSSSSVRYLLLLLSLSAASSLSEQCPGRSLLSV